MRCGAGWGRWVVDGRRVRLGLERRAGWRTVRIRYQTRGAKNETLRAMGGRRHDGDGDGVSLGRVDASAVSAGGGGATGTEAGLVGVTAVCKPRAARRHGEVARRLLAGALSTLSDLNGSGSCDGNRGQQRPAALIGLCLVMADFGGDLLRLSLQMEFSWRWPRIGCPRSALGWQAGLASVRARPPTLVLNLR